MPAHEDYAGDVELVTPTIENLFQRIEKVHPTLQGWCSLDKAFTLASLVVAFRPAVIVEIGVYGGKSLIPMALACQAVGKGIVIGIDPWSTEVAIREQTSVEDREWWGKLDLEKIRVDFMAKLAELNLENFVRIERKESRNIPAPNSISIFHCDGAHNDTAMHDMAKFAPRVIVGGYCVTDDSDWGGGGVKRGEQRLKELGFAHIAALGTGQIFQRLR